MVGTASKLYLIIKEWRSEKISEINHVEIIKSVRSEVEISAGYFLILTIANLIALCGLITDSSPVIIGAMLISPLMGPFLSFGFAFVTGDREIWRSSVKKITLSVLLTILVAAAATYLSPLKEPTGEILSRIKPNLYDLIIAFLAGIAGAGAICTRKYYITIITGVAIATAVIPPLSVTGFGAGTMSFEILSGGFLLFFTNFVAIIISTCIVFYFYDFRPSIFSHYESTKLKRRIAYLAAILFIISIPLVYTLQKSMAEIRLRTSIQDALHSELDRERRSHLTRFAYSVQNEGALRINAVVNTVAYFNDSDIKAMENSVAKSLRRKVRLDLEQIKVKSGGLREVTIPKPSPIVISPPKPPWEIIRDLRQTVISAVGQSTGKIDKILSPAKVTDFSAGFNYNSEALSVLLKIRRDAPFSDTETLWLQRFMSDDLNLPVDLRIETVPFIPPLVFKPGDTTVTPEMKIQILSIKDIYTLDPKAVINVEAYEESNRTRKRAHSVMRLREIKDILENECNIPPDRITASISGKRLPAPTVKITVLLGGQSG
jgi:uncharacterized hydrophobic protein (TIGR00271 family)